MAKVKLLDPTDESRRLDRYELIGEIATGGMATVFLARLGGVGGFQRFVAIKRLHPHLANEDEFVQMFLDEARLAAGIHHPHVVPILEVGTSDSGYYLVMEYVEGDTLARIVARAMSGGEFVPRPILVRCLLDSLAGLHAAHELTDERGQLLGLVHRDISPQNVLVGVDGSSRITDFGVARATSRLSNTGAGRLKGKLAYMAPEQTRGEDLDRRTDLFAMGTILWEVLAGQRLFKASTEAATLSRVLIQPIPRVIEANPDVPPEFEEVTSRALERDPSRRFQTAAEMADALERVSKEAAKSSPTDVGVASPREVAAFVQKVLGQEIGAQRESVRAWLAQSESSAPVVTRPGSKPHRDVTVTVPLDQPGTMLSPGQTRPERSPSAVLARDGSGPESEPPESEDALTNPRLPRDPAMIEDRDTGEGEDEDDDAPTVLRQEAVSDDAHERVTEDSAKAAGAMTMGLPPSPPVPSEPPGQPAPADPYAYPYSVAEPPMNRTRSRTIGLLIGFTIAFLIGLLWVRLRPTDGPTIEPPSARGVDAEERKTGSPAVAETDPPDEPEPGEDPSLGGGDSEAGSGGAGEATEDPPVAATPPRTGAAPPPRPPVAPPPPAETAEPDPGDPPPPPPASAASSGEDFSNPYR